jgi:hypothetical protein
MDRKLELVVVSHEMSGRADFLIARLEDEIGDDRAKNILSQGLKQKLTHTTIHKFSCDAIYRSSRRRFVYDILDLVISEQWSV